MILNAEEKAHKPKTCLRDPLFVNKCHIFNSKYFKRFKIIIIILGMWPAQTFWKRFFILMIYDTITAIIFTGQVLIQNL